MKQLTSAEIDAQDAQDLLEHAVNTSSSLLELLGSLMVAQIDCDSISLYVESLRGLQKLAAQESQNLRIRFGDLVATRERKGGAK